MSDFPRRFVPADCDLGEWPQLQSLFDLLLGRAVATAADLEQWLLDMSELASCLAEERARRYIDMTCNTEDEEIEQRYLHFLETIDPQCKPYWHNLNEMYVASPLRSELPQDRYGVYDRTTEAEIKLFRKDNIPLQTEAAKQSQRYQKLCGAMMVEFDGAERTLPQMGKYLEETERDRRQGAWAVVAQRRLQERDDFNAIFDELVRLRHQIAQNAGFEDYVGYAFLNYKRFDYTPQHCFDFHQAVETCVVPLARRLNDERKAALKVDSLRPWDLSVDPLGRSPLRPFQAGEDLLHGVKRIIHHYDEELSAQLAEMYAQGELDLESRKGKAPGGYQYTLEEVRRPFIFMNAAGLQRDVETLLHEAGHAFHAIASRNEPLVDYRSSPIEFAEVASMSMELFGQDYFEEFYSKDDALRAKRLHLEGVIKILPWIAQIDAFQHWIYTHPTHTRDERTAQWLELSERFGGGVDWTGFEEVQQSLWQRQLHLYCHAFYYIEYGIAQLGALQLWGRYKVDSADALRRYRQALALGGSRPLPKLFEAAGIHFDFSEATIKPLTETIEAELKTLPL
ncbi:MAG: M3 family oligoendopeptidase [Candidatus Hinthialibacter antarcticus]|nr:M3 family oligoendopeptidase [Candidatus Hinthialibacter antarcticus]